MKLFILMMFPFIIFAQKYTLEEIGDDYLFSPFSIVYTYTYLDDGIEVVKRNSNNLGLFIFIDSSKLSSIVQRYYETGMISMIITNFEFNIRINDSTILYCTSGKVKTFYPNGKLRTEYYLDSLGKIVGELKQYSIDGQKLNSIKFKNGKIWSGIYICEYGNQSFFISIIKKGIERHCLYFREGFWYDKENNTIRENKILKKIKQTYYLLNNYALIFPDSVGW